MTEKKTLSPDEYQIFYGNDNKGILYYVESLMQPTYHSCWAVSTATLLSFADLITKPVLLNDQDPNHSYFVHFDYVKNLVGQMCLLFMDKNPQLYNKYLEKFYNAHNIPEYPQTYQDFTNSFHPKGNHIDYINERELWDIIISNIGPGSYGRFQNYEIQMNLLVEKSRNDENDRRRDFKLSDYSDIEEFFKNNNLPVDPDQNLYMKDGQVQFLSDADVRTFINNHFLKSDSDTLPEQEFKEFFEDMCGLIMEPSLPELTYYSTDKIGYYFLKLLCQYGPLVIAYDLDRRTDEKGLKSFHFIVLCGIHIMEGERILYIVMDPWDIKTDAHDPNNPYAPFKALEGNEFTDNFRALTSDFAHANSTEALPSQIFHLPKGYFIFSKSADQLNTTC